MKKGTRTEQGMDQERITAFRELLVTQMNHWALYPLVMTAAGLTDMEYIPLWQWILCSLAPFVFFFVRRYTNGFLMLALSHAGMWICFWLLPSPNLIMKAALQVFLTCYLIYSLFLRIARRDRLDGSMHPGMTLGITAAALMLLHYHGQKRWDIYYVITLILCMGLHFLHYYLEQYLRFLVVNDSSAGHIPEKEIFRSGIGLAALYTAAGMVILLLTADIGWLGKIAGFFKMLLVWLLKLLPRGFGEDDVSETPQKAAAERGFTPPLENQEPFWLWELMEKLLLAAFFLLLAAVVLWGIWKLVQFLAARFRTSLKIESTELKTVRDVREKCGIERRKSDKTPFFSFLTVQDRIRRIYKKKIWSSRFELEGDGNAEALKILTARECCGRLKAQSLSQVYEKARYSNETCTAEDIKKAKHGLDDKRA